MILARMLRRDCVRHIFRPQLAGMLHFPFHRVLAGMLLPFHCLVLNGFLDLLVFARHRICNGKRKDNQGTHRSPKEPFNNKKAK
jgi:hypothetical protein